MLLFCLPLSGQQNKEYKDRRVSFSLRFEQNFYLNDWFDYPYDCGNTPGTYGLDILFQMNIDFSSNYGAWINVGPCAFGGGKDFSMDYDPFAGDGSEYYIPSDKSDIHKYSYSAARLEVGAYRTLTFGKWRLRPSLGVGMLVVPSADIKYELKEKNSNNHYDVEHIWFGNSGSQNIGYILLGCEVNRRLSPKISLAMGVNYRTTFNRPSFRVKVYDHYGYSWPNSYSPSPISEIKHKGNIMNIISINATFSFHLLKRPQKTHSFYKNGVMYYPAH